MNKYPIESGELAAAPFYAVLKSSNHWLAKLSLDRKSGDLKREFMDKTGGPNPYVVKGIEPGDVLEFAADYIASDGQCMPLRHYVVVLSMTKREMVFEEFGTAKAAFAYASMLEKIALAKVKAAAQPDLSKVPTEELVEELRKRGVCVDSMCAIEN